MKKHIRKFYKRSVFLSFLLLLMLTAGCGVQESVNTLKEYYSYTTGKANEYREEPVLPTSKPVSVQEEPVLPTSKPVSVQEEPVLPTSKPVSGQDAPTSAPETAAEVKEETAPDTLDSDGSYTTAEDVSLYLVLYGKLPQNFITKKEAQKLGWNGGSLEPYAPGKCIGGDYFGNYEGLLPQGHEYHECDIGTLGAKSRGAKRLVYSNDGLIYYTKDHYESFELLYGEE